MLYIDSSYNVYIYCTTVWYGMLYYVIQLACNCTICDECVWKVIYTLHIVCDDETITTQLFTQPALFRNYIYMSAQHCGQPQQVWPFPPGASSGCHQYCRGPGQLSHRYHPHALSAAQVEASLQLRPILLGAGQPPTWHTMPLGDSRPSVLMDLMLFLQACCGCPRVNLHNFAI